MPALLEVENLHAGYGPIEVLKGISLRIEPGEIVALIGANGAGKTTTLMSISGCVRCRSGRISFGGRQITALPPHEIVRAGLCQSPEGRKIFPRLSVLENLAMGAFTRRDKPGVKQDTRARAGNVSDPQTAARSGRRHAVGRRAANAGRGPGADGPPQAAAVGRAFAGPGAAGGAEDFRSHPRIEPRGHGDSVGGASRADGAANWRIAAM